MAKPCRSGDNSCFNMRPIYNWARKFYRSLFSTKFITSKRRRTNYRHNYWFDSISCSIRKYDSYPWGQAKNLELAQTISTNKQDICKLATETLNLKSRLAEVEGKVLTLSRSLPITEVNSSLKDWAIEGAEDTSYRVDEKTELAMEKKHK